MTAEDVFESFEAFCDKQTRVQVLLASEDDEEDLVFQRLTLTDSVSKEFGDDAINAFADGENLTLVKYQPGYKPDDDELCYLRLDQSELVRNVVESIIECASSFWTSRRDCPSSTT